MNDNFLFFNKITNTKIIKFTPCYFAYVEHKDFISINPLNDYYFKINDISINILISLKWILFGFFYFKSISESLIEINNSEKNIYNILPKNTKNVFENNQHVLYIDNFQINNNDDFIFIINNEYSKDIYDENTKIRIKLKINLNDLILLQNCYIPTIYFL